MEKHTVAIQFAIAAVARLQPIARGRVLRAAGIPPDLLKQTQARLPGEAFSALWMAIAAELDDEFFDLDRRGMKVGSFAMLVHSVLPCETIERAARQLLRGFAVLLDDIHGELSVDGDEAVVTLMNRVEDPGAHRFAAETFLVMFHGTICWLAGRRIALTSAEFDFPRPSHAREYSVMFCDRSTFESPATAIRFGTDVLDAPIVQSIGSLKAFLKGAPQSVFLKYRNEDSWTARLRRRLRNQQGALSWPTLNEMAALHHVAATTLRRRLDAEGTTYQRIKDDVRCGLAMHQLCASDLDIADIGFHLGFQEPSAFYRAFKRWTGLQPGAFRAQRSKRANGA